MSLQNQPASGRAIDDRGRKDLCRHAVAVDVVEVSQAQDGHGQRGGHHSASTWSPFLRVCGALRPRAVLSQVQAGAARPRSTSATPRADFARPFVYQIVRTKDPETLRDLYNEDTETIYPIRFFVRGTDVQVLGAVEDRPAPLWPGRPARGAGRLSAGRGPAGAGPVLPPLLRRAHLALHRPGRRLAEPVPGHPAGRHLGLLWRHRGHHHPAGHRVPALHAQHPALDGAQRRRCPPTGRWYASTLGSRSSSR